MRILFSDWMCIFCVFSNVLRILSSLFLKMRSIFLFPLLSTHQKIDRNTEKNRWLGGIMESHTPYATYQFSCKIYNFNKFHKFLLKYMRWIVFRLGGICSQSICSSFLLHCCSDGFHRTCMRVWTCRDRDPKSPFRTEHFVCALITLPLPLSLSKSTLFNFRTYAFATHYFPPHHNFLLDRFLDRSWLIIIKKFANNSHSNEQHWMTLNPLK